MQWAAPLTGLAGNTWVAPITRLWEKLRPGKGLYDNLFPMVNDKWDLVSKRVGTYGSAQNALNRFQNKIGTNLKLKLHSPRTFFATCAGRLRIPREERAKLGMWAAGSLMPDRYGRAVCVTELATRGDIIKKINQDGWRPQGAFCAPQKAMSPHGSADALTQDSAHARDPEISDNAISSDSMSSTSEATERIDDI